MTATETGSAAPAYARPHTLTWVGASVGALAGLAHLGLLLYIFIGRLTYPFDLEWMEGGMLCHALRIMEGRPFYVSPSADFISYLYTPLYPFLLAALGKVVGLSYAVGRAVSILCFLGTLALVVRAVWREAGTRQGLLWGLLAAGLVASSFQFTGAWYDLVRNDSLYLFLVTACLYLVRFHARSWRAVVGAGVLAGLAFLAKQTASLFIVYSGLALLLSGWRRLPAYVGVVAAVAGGTVLFLNRASDGWFWKYVFEMHQGHDLYWDRVWPVTERQLFNFFPVVAVVIGLWLLAAPLSWAVRRRVSLEDRALLYWIGVAVTGVVVSAVGFATQWASANAYIPGLVFPSVAAAMVGARAARRSSGKGWVIAVAATMLVGGALGAQLLGQLYRPGPHLPTARDRRTGVELIALLRRIDGPVMMPYHPFYPYLAGKRPTYPQMGINDVTRAGHPFPAEIYERVMRRYYAAVILDNPPQGRYDFLLGPYKLARYFRGHEVPRHIEGYAVRPTYFFVPKRPDPVPPGGRRLFGFEEGGFAGWRSLGSAFGEGPVGGPLWDQGPVGPFEGSFLVNSFHGGDAARGVLASPPFIVDRPVLAYRIGGGRRPGELELRLVVGGEIVYRATGSGSDIMEERRVDVRTHLGSTMHAELVDQAVGPWGHILFDDLMLLER